VEGKEGKILRGRRVESKTGLGKGENLGGVDCT